MLVLLLFVIVFVIVYLYGIRTFNYWEERGIKHDRPLPFVGNNLNNFVQKASMAMMASDVYRRYPDEKLVGFYKGTSPELVIRDPEIAKTILVADFQHFYARGFNPHKTVIEPLLKNIFFADGDLWRLIRQRFTPAFSTSKLKAMFPLITKSAAKLQSITEDIANQDHYDARELMARYTTDFIGECGFGINMDSLSDENSQFRKLGKRIFKRTFMDGLRGALKLIFPDLCKHLSFLDAELEKTMVHLYHSVCKERNYKPSGRNDFIDLMLELKEKGEVVVESLEKRKPNGEPEIVKLELTDLIMTAQMFVFFGAGFETSSTASSYTLHQLAFNPDCQEKVRMEIDRVLAKYNNVITYDAIREMSYLEMTFYEAMRMYPSVAYLIRMCTSKEYTFPGTNLTINEGVKVVVPIQAIHMDEKYFRDPERFDPDRFTFGYKDDMKNFVFLPFGEGPRSCVGARLGQMQSMAGIAAVLHKYTVEPAVCTVRHPKPDPTGIVSESFVGGLPLKFRRRVPQKYD